MYKKIAKDGYIYLFTSFKIDLSKKLKINIFDHFSFSNRFYLLAVDEIYLINQ